ncbi:cupin domain-containing protein [Mucilaginibacter lappiensis]|uniref:Quercetin dioxygenase-like cupin family protein n=1 Tax=Mucilaginibacter lappiensis TaxID=354630 RepID=A0A1N6SPG2_9SPHI|nr:cupin domain-containing protein [Mucilaginibacter lappiensis]MBB6108307.1 quercetin dioxygenase-like cupin family protein [Mucilaginibacter lappiensis]MBB6129933.1 quercetin dioxygenase-like cupin family protein [Mucilaginibacter lappiensis]SIQ43018.1 Cupin domain-containing protein [Mucilaginibacter lappiensis]
MKTLFITILTLLSPYFGKLNAPKHTHRKIQSNITETYLLKTLLNQPGINNKEVQMLVVTFPPASVSPAHRHPFPTFGYLLEGELESTFEGKTYHYKPGDSFYEKPNGLHAVTRNSSKDKPAKLLVFFIAEKNKATTVPVKTK